MVHFAAQIRRAANIYKSLLDSRCDFGQPEQREAHAMVRMKDNHESKFKVGFGMLRVLTAGVLLIYTSRILCAPAPDSFDLVITSGHIIDGTGSPWYSGDIGIRNGKIAAIGYLGAAQAKRTIDAHGMVIAPGFIDMLGQSELTILVNPH